MEIKNKIHSTSIIAADEYCRINCVISEADFNTNHPNSHRLDKAAGEIGEYLRLKKNYNKRLQEGEML